MRKRANVVVFLWALSSAALPGRPSHAQEKDAVTETARRRFQEGVKFFDQKRFEDARAAFLQAYALKHHPTVLLNLAQSEIRSGHPLEAARHFSAFLRQSPDASPAQRAEAEKGLASARSKLGRIQVSVTAGAEVRVDGEAMGEAPLPDAVDVAPGTHTVEAKLAGQTRTVSVTVLVGESVNASLTLANETPVAVAPAPPAPIPTPPPPTPEPPPSLPATAGRQESAPPSGEPSGEVSTEGREPFFRWLGHNGGGILGLGVTGIGIGVFVGFEIAAKHASNTANNLQVAIHNEAVKENIASANVCGDPVPTLFVNACNSLHDNLKKRDTDRTLATVGIVAAGVGLTATIAGYFLTSNRSSTHSSQAVVIPVVGPQRVGLAVVGSF